MRIVQFSLSGHLRLQVHFEDECSLDVEFDPDRLHGLCEPLRAPSEFAAAFLRDGTVAWPCGAQLDSQVARVKADEVSVWRPG